MTSGAARRRRGLFLRVLSVSALIGVGVRSVVGRLVPHGGPRTGALVGALTGLMIAATVGVPGIFLMRTRPGRALEQTLPHVDLLRPPDRHRGRRPSAKFPGRLQVADHHLVSPVEQREKLHPDPLQVFLDGHALDLAHPRCTPRIR